MCKTWISALFFCKCSFYRILSCLESTLVHPLEVLILKKMHCTEIVQSGADDFGSLLGKAQAIPATAGSATKKSGSKLPQSKTDKYLGRILLRLRFVVKEKCLRALGDITHLQVAEKLVRFRFLGRSATGELRLCGLFKKADPSLRSG